MNTLPVFRRWVALLLLLLVALGLAACDAGQTAETETLPAPDGPALLFFYTDG